MRKIQWTLAVVIAILAAGASGARAGEGCACSVAASASACDPCHGAGCRHGCGCGLFGHHGWGNRIEGLDANFNCGCRGSYNYPVPPQYTYHWPGMYKQNLMTDYRSPWRFPPLKPYLDEQPMPAAAVAHPMLLPVSTDFQLEPVAPQNGEIESIASRLERMHEQTR